jgi:hypothetical protein
MLGNLIRMAAGRAVARQVGGVSAGPLGMAAGAALPFVLRRFGPMGLIGAAVGGYAVKKYLDKRNSGAAAARYPGGTDPNFTRP